MMQQKLLMCLTNSQVHVGVGQALDTIDLPIQRERMTGWPYIPGSALKGVLRDHFLQNDSLNAYFGAGTDTTDSAGLVGFPDLNILAFPVRCLEKGFVMITSPKVLQRFLRNLKRMNGYDELRNIIDTIPASSNDEQIYGVKSEELHLEEFALRCREDKKMEALIASLDTLLEESNCNLDNLVLVTDRMFQYFVNHATEVQARIAIDQKTGTVKTGALFYEEYLPSDTLLYGVLSMERSRLIGSATFKDFCELVPDFVQIGGGSTTGKGIVNLVFCGGGE